MVLDKVLDKVKFSAFRKSLDSEIAKENTGMKFIDRERELGTLRRMSASGQKELLVLYGRRRLGKTTLLY